MVLKLREMWQSLFSWRTSFPSKPYNQKEQTILKTLISVCHVPFSTWNFVTICLSEK